MFLFDLKTLQKNWGNSSAMFVKFRRIHKCQCARLLTTAFLLCVVMLCWEDLDHHVVSHMKSYTYRYMVNSYDFLNSSLAINPDSQRRDFGDVSEAPVVHPYLINHPKKCAHGKDMLLLLFVKSSPDNNERRHAIRDTWGNESFIWTLRANVKVLFVLGVHPDITQRSRVQKALEQEDWKYGDIIQQDFVDTFHNLTTKLILQFHWAYRYCLKAQFVMSADDDIFVHMPNLVKYLQNLQGSQERVSNFWVGHVHRGAPPVRRKTSKYHVPFELYPWLSYPDYTAGAGYVVSGDVAGKIYHAMLALNSSMYIDDVFMGMCAEAMGLSPQDEVYFSGEAKAPYHPCIYSHMITSHGHTLDVRSLWLEATDPRVQHLSRGFLSNVYCTAVRVALLCLPHYQETYSCKAAFT